MKVYIPKYSGFCPGVKLAEKNLFKIKKDHSAPIYVLGKLIHNTQYINYLKKNDILTSDSVNKIPTDSIVAIRTHGISWQLEKDLRKKIKVLDLTCSKVKQLQKTIQRYSEKGYFVVITGKKDHPEILGLKSYATNFYLIEEDADIVEFENFVKVKKASDISSFKKLLVVSQTTGSRELFEKASEKIKEILGQFAEIRVIDSICSITSLREEEALKMQKYASYTFVVGDHISANANRLYNTLKKNKNNTYFIENLLQLKELKLPLKSNDSSLVVSSSSTPEFIEREIVEYLASI